MIKCGRILICTGMPKILVFRERGRSPLLVIISPLLSPFFPPSQTTLRPLRPRKAFNALPLPSFRRNYTAHLRPPGFRKEGRARTNSMPTNGTMGGHGLKKRVTLLVVTCKAINGLLPLRRMRSGARGQEALQSKEDKIGNFFRRARLAYLSYLSAKIAVSTQNLSASPGTKMSLVPAKEGARDWLSQPQGRTRSGFYANWMLMLMGSQ